MGISSPSVRVNERLKALLNEAIAAELQVAIQYMYQHIQASGVLAVAINEKFRNLAIAEMKHAEQIADRLWYLNGTPTVRPLPITVGQNLDEFLRLDIEAELKTIALYKRIILEAEAQGDITTVFLFKKILEEEEGHHDFFTTLAG